MAEIPHGTTHPHRAHEQRDVNIHWVAVFGVCLVVLLIGGLLLMDWLFATFDSESQRLATPAPRATIQPLPPKPHLQASPAQDLQEMRQTEDALVHGYAWVDQAADIVRIPIEDAIAFVAQHGLPDWRQAPNRQQDSTHPAGAGEHAPQGSHRPQGTEEGK